MNDELREHRLRALFGAGVLLLNFPLLALWDRDALLFGVPLFPAALFGVWVVLIVALACIVESAPAVGADTAAATDVSLVVPGTDASHVAPTTDASRAAPAAPP